VVALTPASSNIRSFFSLTIENQAFFSIQVSYTPYFGAAPPCSVAKFYLFKIIYMPPRALLATFVYPLSRDRTS
jgi:hypothetical protein